jgi:hypothetical protein
LLERIYVLVSIGRLKGAVDHFTIPFGKIEGDWVLGPSGTGWPSGGRAEAVRVGFTSVEGKGRGMADSFRGFPYGEAGEMRVAGLREQVGRSAVERIN